MISILWMISEDVALVGNNLPEEFLRRNIAKVRVGSDASPSRPLKAALRTGTPWSGTTSTVTEVDGGHVCLSISVRLYQIFLQMEQRFCDELASSLRFWCRLLLKGSRETASLEGECNPET